VRQKNLTIETPGDTFSASFTGVRGGAPVLVLAHGAGRDMNDPLLEGFAEGLASEGVSCLRFNFPYREKGRKAPDPEPVLRETWQAAFDRGGALGSPVWVGGKSLGGRIASMVVADGLPAAGLVFVGYPLHPPGRPERIRDSHLPAIRVPILWLQGTADAFARWDLLERTIGRLGDLVTVHAIERGDHSFHVRGAKKDDSATGRELGEIAGRFIISRG
jgi:predicted alpha/beta-hydrolase family hydrolase